MRSSERSAAHVDPQKINAQRHAVKAAKVYGRGSKIQVRSIKDNKLRANLAALEEKYKDATLKAKDAEILLENEHGFLEPAGVLEKTYKVRQSDIQSEIAIDTARKGFELKLDQFGPYKAEYTRNGRDLLLAGRKGHIATIDWRDGKLRCELQMNETVRDAKWLHNDQTFAVAQKKHVHIYDKAGVEIHKLQKHVEVTDMEFLPYHFLLATVAKSGYLKYTDTSTGQLVAELPTKQGSPTAFGQNPHNAVVHVGHQNGTVTLWSPNTNAPLVKLLAHRGPVRSLAVDREGRYMVSAGQDLRMAVWDIRTFKEVHNYSLRRPGSSIAISDRGLTAVGWGSQISVWKGLYSSALEDQIKIQSPYMAWNSGGQIIARVRWCPSEDILGVAHDQGFHSLIVPGAGEPNIDALELNPYENTKQRQEGEVKSLLNKIQPDMISLNPNYVGHLDLASPETRKKEADENRKPEDVLLRLKNRGRGKSSSLRKYMRRKGTKNVIDDRRLRTETLLQQQRKSTVEAAEPQQPDLGPALARFTRNSA